MLGTTATNRTAALRRAYSHETILSGYQRVFQISGVIIPLALIVSFAIHRVLETNTQD